MTGGVFGWAMCIKQRQQTCDSAKCCSARQVRASKWDSLAFGCCWIACNVALWRATRLSKAGSSIGFASMHIRSFSDMMCGLHAPGMSRTCATSQMCKRIVSFQRNSPPGVGADLVARLPQNAGEHGCNTAFPFAARNMDDVQTLVGRPHFCQKLVNRALQPRWKCLLRCGKPMSGLH